MTRTHWLLVVLIGLVAWLAGYTLKEPLFGVPGVLAVIIGVVGAITTKSPDA